MDLSGRHGERQLDIILWPGHAINATVTVVLNSEDMELVLSPCIVFVTNHQVHTPPPSAD